MHFTNIYCTLCPQFLERKYATLFSVFISVCGEDTFLSESCLLSTMVTTSLQWSLSCQMHNLRHLQMPPEITLKRRERVCFNIKGEMLLTVSWNEPPKMEMRNGIQPTQQFLPLLWTSQFLFIFYLFFLPILSIVTLVFAPYLVLCMGGLKPMITKDRGQKWSDGS